MSAKIDGHQRIDPGASPTFAGLTVPTIYGSAAASGTLTLKSTSHATLGNVSIGRMTLSDLANSNGIVFGSLGTATVGIDLSACGLSGSGDYWIYNSATSYWDANGSMKVGNNIVIVNNCTADSFVMASGGGRIFLSAANQSIRVGLTYANQALIIGNMDAIGFLTACTRNATTTITKTTHGLSVAAGNLVQVTASTGSTDLGFYTLISSTADTLVVDRALSGSDASVALTIYKNVIGVFATDATNGQRIMNYSHQNKPLQIGGHTLAATTDMTSEDVTLGGVLNVDVSTGNVGIGTSAPDGQLSTGLANGQQVSYKSLTELTTIAAGATTDTTIQIPANVIVKAVSVRVTVVIPTAATFTVIGTTTSTIFNTAAVSVAATTTNKGNLNCPYNNAAAQTIRITPNDTPADNSGRVRVTIWYEDSIPPTS